jgi:hypothetical protein
MTTVRTKKPRSKVVNVHRVPQKQWRKWDDPGKQLFNDVYANVLLTARSKVLMHPRSNRKKFTDEEFDTLAWNTAWIAADCVTTPEIVFDDVVTVPD